MGPTWCHVAATSAPYNQISRHVGRRVSRRVSEANGTDQPGSDAWPRAAESAPKLGGILVNSAKFRGRLVIFPRRNDLSAPALSPNLRANQRGAAVISPTGRGQFGQAEKNPADGAFYPFAPPHSRYLLADQAKRAVISKNSWGQIGHFGLRRWNLDAE